jgi:hypothetical protein
MVRTRPYIIALSGGAASVFWQDLCCPDRTGWPFEASDDRCNTPQGTPDIDVPVQKEAFPRHIGRTKGSLNSKLHAVCDDQGRPVRLHLTARQVSDFKGANVLLADLSDETEEVISGSGRIVLPPVASLYSFANIFSIR